MCPPVGCAWHIYVNGRCIAVSFQKNVWVQDVERCMVCKCMDGIGFGWKVHGMVHGKRCMAFFYTPVGIRKAKRRPFCSQAAGHWPLSILQPKKLHIFCYHLTWIAAVLLITTHGQQGLVKWEPRQTWHCSCQAQCNFVQNCILLSSINYLLAVDTGRPPLDKYHTPPVLLWYPQVSPK